MKCMCMNLQPYIIYMYIYLYKKPTWPEVKATYKVVQVIILVKTMIKLTPYMHF